MAEKSAAYQHQALTVRTADNMPASTEPAVILSHLHRTDGSATFSQNGYTIIGAVNGPIEVQRRDELPEEAAVDVIIRPAAGVGGVLSCRCMLCYSS